MRKAIFVAVVAAHLALVWYFLTLWRLPMPLDEDQSSMTMVFLPPPELTGITEESTRERTAQHAAEPTGRRRAYASFALPESAARESVPHESASRESASSQRPSRSPPSAPALANRTPADQTPTHHVAPPQPPIESPKPTDSDQPTPLLPSIPQEAPANGTPSFIVPMPDWHQQAEIVAQSEAPGIVEAEDRAKRQARALTAMIKPMPGSRIHGPSFHWDPNPRYRWQPAQGGGFVIPLNDHCEVFVLIMIWVGCSVGKLPPAHGDLFLNMHPPVKYGDWDWRLDDP